jgi:hypothetical protein
MERIVTNDNLCGVLLVICLWAGILAECATSEAVGRRGAENRLLSSERIAVAEGSLRSKGYDVNNVEALRAATTDAAVGVRHNALIVLAHKLGREAVPILVPALDDRQSLVRCTAARLLTTLGDPRGLDRMRKDLVELAKPLPEANPPQSQQAKDQVRKSVRHPEVGRQYDAVEAALVLAEFGDSSGYELAAQAVLQSEYAAIRSTAVAVLANLSRVDETTMRAKGRNPEAVLLKVIESEVQPAVLSMVANCAMSKMKPESQIRILEKLQGSSRIPDMQRKAIQSGLKHARKQLEESKQKPTG